MSGTMTNKGMLLRLAGGSEAEVAIGDRVLLACGLIGEVHSRAEDGVVVFLKNPSSGTFQRMRIAAVIAGDRDIYSVCSREGVCENCGELLRECELHPGVYYTCECLA